MSDSTIDVQVTSAIAFQRPPLPSVPAEPLLATEPDQSNQKALTGRYNRRGDYVRQAWYVHMFAFQTRTTRSSHVTYLISTQCALPKQEGEGSLVVPAIRFIC